ncbi:ribonuclease P (plasmid) [Jeotgalibacillus malaysiensis]|uniref:Ribonuclease P n=1 Tax=Jeotgalibacillus malaysiensis TaxID=1508404 RepID=A0A0B5B0F9_9BACL|nr:PH domain-containing protein [Jeotgalibacillus malaysiensis]AJD93659.1 ribonuclease P [Jeotgalibacillus malaysiensis]
MFKKLGSDLLGLSDIGKILTPEQFSHADVDDYILNEDNEKIYFVIKSKTDEYCFTNLALIHLDGESAVSSKRLLSRYDYYYEAIDQVQLETAGTVDLDVELKFTIGGESFSIDVDKNQLDKLKDLYKALYKISVIQDQNKAKMNYAVQSQELASRYLERAGMSAGQGSGVVSDFEAIRNSTFEFMKEQHQANLRTDYGDVFEKYINN